MPAFSANATRQINSTEAAELPRLCLEIHHVDLASPVRVVNDNQDLVHQANLYVAMAFQASLPDDLEQGMPRASLAIDNVGKELVSWLEQSNGGEGAQVRMLLVMRSDPDLVEWEVTMGLTNVSMTSKAVTGTLSFEDTLNLTGLPVTYRPDVSPGLF